MQFRSEKLSNGLEVIAEVNPEAFSLSLGYFVKTGSRDETPEMAGVSHFLEHMMFKGTARRTAEDVNQELDDLGGANGLLHECLAGVPACCAGLAQRYAASRTSRRRFSNRAAGHLGGDRNVR